MSYKNTDTFPTDCLYCGHGYSTAPKEATLWKQFCFAFKKYYSLRGRATQREFWGYTLYYIIFGVIAQYLAVKSLSISTTSSRTELDPQTMSITLIPSKTEIAWSTPTHILVWGFLLVFLVPTFAVIVRRLHDINRSMAPLLIAIALQVPLGVSLSLPTFAEIPYLTGGLLLVNVIYSIYMLILLSKASHYGSNAYGSSCVHPIPYLPQK